MVNQVLISVMHRDEDQEFNSLKSLLDQYHPSTVGLELPDNYLELSNHGVTIYFFSKAEKYLTDNGLQVIPLDSQDCWEELTPVLIAKSVLEGKQTLEGLRKEIDLAFKKRKDAYTSPEACYCYSRFYNQGKKALELLKAGLDTATLQGLWRKCMDNRNEVMLERILQHNPDCVILGDGHVQELTDRLNGYKIISLA